MIKRLLIFIISLILNVSHLLAHNPKDVSYSIKTFEYKEIWQLRIDLTPQAAILLVKAIQPELQNESIIYLNQYQKEFELYFNETVKINDGKNPTLKLDLVDFNLQSHESYLLFDIHQFQPKSNQTISISITSFDGIIKNIVQYTSFEFNKKKYKCELTHEQTTCIINLPNDASNKAFPSSNYLYIILISVFLLLAVFFLAKNPL